MTECYQCNQEEAGICNRCLNDMLRARECTVASAQSARISALERALEPLAALCQWLTEDTGPNGCADDEAILVTDWEVGPRDRDQITAGMIRTARRALRGQSAEGAGSQGPGARGEGE